MSVCRRLCARWEKRRRRNMCLHSGCPNHHAALRYLYTIRHWEYESETLLTLVYRCDWCKTRFGNTTRP